MSVKRISAIFLAAAVIFSFCIHAAAENTANGFQYTVSGNSAVITAYTGAETEIVIPEAIGGCSVTELSDAVFSGNTVISAVTIPKSVKTIGANAFKGCTAIKKLSYTGTVAEWCGITFKGYYSNPALYSHGLIINGEIVTSAEIPYGMTAVGDYTFFCFYKLEAVKIPDTVTKIGAVSFYGCSVLKEIKLPAGVTAIGNNAFYACKGLSSITVPNSVTSIGGNAFRTLNSAFVLKCFKGSYADTYAKNNSITTQYLNNCTHSYGEWIIRKTATCVSAGEKYRVCDLCYKTEVEEIPAAGNHTYGEWIISKEAACTAQGEKYRICTLCNNKETAVIPAAGHSFSDEWTVDIPPTYFETGEKSHHCTCCDARSDITEIPIIKSDKPILYSDNVTAYPGGQILLPIKVAQNTGIVGAGIRVWYDKNVMTPVSVTAGEILGTQCAVSDNADTADGMFDFFFCNAENIGTDGVLFSVLFDVSENAAGSAAVRLDFSGDDTFDESFNDVQFLCLNAEITVSGEHSFGEWITDEPATCILGGKKHRLCADCGKSETVIIPALGHSFSEEFTVDTAPTEISAGSKSRHCTRCDARTDITELPVLAPAGPTVSLKQISASGGKLAFDIVITGNTGLMGLKLTLGYDKSVITPTAVTAGSILSGGMSNNSIESADGEFDIFWSGTGNMENNGVLFTVVFDITDKTRKTVSVTLASDTDNTFDENWQDVRLNCIGSEVTLLATGDLNGDGKIDILDLIRLKKNSAADDKKTDVSDINGDGLVNSADIALLKKYLLGVITTL